MSETELFISEKSTEESQNVDKVEPNLDFQKIDSSLGGDTPTTPQASSCCSCCHSAGKSFGCDEERTFQNFSDVGSDSESFEPVKVDVLFVAEERLDVGSSVGFLSKFSNERKEEEKHDRSGGKESFERQKTELRNSFREPSTRIKSGTSEAKPLSNDCLKVIDLNSFSDITDNLSPPPLPERNYSLGSDTGRLCGADVNRMNDSVLGNTTNTGRSLGAKNKNIGYSERTSDYSIKNQDSSATIDNSKHKSCTSSSVSSRMCRKMVHKDDVDLRSFQSHDSADLENRKEDCMNRSTRENEGTLRSRKIPLGGLSLEQTYSCNITSVSRAGSEIRRRSIELCESSAASCRGMGRNSAAINSKTLWSLDTAEVQKDGTKKRTSLRGLFRRRTPKKMSHESSDCSESPDCKSSRRKQRSFFVKRQHSIDDLSAGSEGVEKVESRRERGADYVTYYADTTRSSRCAEPSGAVIVNHRPRSLLARLSRTLRNPFMRRDRSVSAVRYSVDTGKPAEQRNQTLTYSESRRSRGESGDVGSGRVGRRAECLGRAQTRGRAISPDTRPIVSNDACSRIHYSASRCAGDGSATRSDEDDLDVQSETRRETRSDTCTQTEDVPGLWCSQAENCHMYPDFIKSLAQLKECGWYWGPLDWEEAENLLMNEEDGAFLVRDSSNDHYILSLTFRAQGSIHHTRIEHYKVDICDAVSTPFLYYEKPECPSSQQPKSHGAATIVDFIETAMDHSRSGRYLYFLRPRGAGHPPAPVQLLHPISRLTHVPSLQHRCRFVILQHVRRDHIQHLPVPSRVQDYLLQAQYYAEK